MKEITNIHDKYFKEFMENPEIARELLEVILPSEIKEIIDLERLLPQKASFISQELEGAYSDLLFKSRLKEGGEIYVYFLIEHKSYYYEYTSLQLLKYMLNIWEREIDKENRRELTPIIPVVFYHGEEKWKIPFAFKKLIKDIEKYPALERYIPVFEHILFELKPEIDLDNDRRSSSKTVFENIAFEKEDRERRICSIF